MKHFKLNTGLFFFLILSFYTLRFVCSNFMESIFVMYLIPTFWVASFIYLKTKNPFESRLHKVRTQENSLFIIIIITVYIMVNFALGLFLSYGKNPYSPRAMIYLWEFVFFVFFQEYIRFLMISNTKENFLKVISVILLFIFIEVHPTYFANDFTNEKIVEYIIYILIPISLENLIFAYFAKMYTSGYMLSFIYRTYMGFYTYVMPIYPNLKKDAALLLRIMLILIIFFKTAITENGPEESNGNKKHAGKEEKFIRKKKNHVFYSLVFSISLITLVFVSGITGYFPLAIYSGSMHGSIETGDVVIIKKITGEQAATSLKEGEILVYKLNDALIVHRIIKIENSPINSEKYYITKGDANNTPDKAKVYPNQIIGKTKYKMPYLGFPAIMMKRYLSII